MSVFKPKTVFKEKLYVMSARFWFTRKSLKFCQTLIDGDENVFGIRRNPQLAICPIKGIEQYMAVARDLRIDLTSGYLFRPTNPQGGVVDSPFSSSTAEARL